MRIAFSLIQFSSEQNISEINKLQRWLSLNGYHFDLAAHYQINEKEYEKILQVARHGASCQFKSDLLEEKELLLSRQEKCIQMSNEKAKKLDFLKEDLRIYRLKKKYQAQVLKIEEEILDIQFSHKNCRLNIG